MKSIKQFLSTVFVFGLLFSFAACDDDTINGGNGDGDGTENETYTAIINNYVDKTIIPTYESLRDEAKKLNEAVETFKQEPTQANLETACEQWRATRIPWEESESFLFGPVANQQIDPHLDSWPLNQTNINAILGGSIKWTDADGEQLEDGSSMGAATLGFHTLEYLMFEGGEPRKASDILERNDKESYLWYMVVVSQVLSNDAFQVYALWAGEDNLSSEEAELAEELGIADLTAKGYGARFKNPNPYDQVFPNQKACLDAIIDGCVDIATEVADAKIGEPYNNKDVYGVESWYSFNSFTDYDNNITSIENSFMGGPKNNRDSSSSLYTYIKSKDSVAAENVKQLIADAHNALTGMPKCFRDMVLDNANGIKSPEVEEAMSIIGELSEAMNKLKPLVK
ncbi:putative iron-regulated protein [Dysgonomonadaceae bacterium PH5-43]|nr:putative iron-regulated protein [Dysgonomonadaceae bacterium PH5-43]